MIRAARALVLGVATLCCLVLIGYPENRDYLVHVRPGLEGMSPVTALALLLAALSLLAQTLERPAACRAIAWGALLAGAGMLGVHGLYGTDPVSPFVATHILGWTGPNPGRTSAATALCIAGLAVAILCRNRFAIADGCTGAVLLISGLAIIGYAYGVHDLYALPLFDTMALHTALALFALAVAFLCSRSQGGWSAVIAAEGVAGAATRRQLGFIAVPAVLAWVLLRATDSDRLGPGAAMAFLVVLTATPLALLVIRDGRRLIALEAQRQAQAALRASRDQELQERLASQAQALMHESAERAKAEEAIFRTQRLDAIGQLTGGIAHDFNNLLMAISGNLDLMVRRHEAGHPALRFSANIETAVERGKKLTGQLLAFSRTQKLEIRPIAVDASLASARALIGNALGSGITLSLHLDTPGCWALTDPDQLELAILNLAINARDAMPSGGKLSLESALVREGPSGNERDYIAIRLKDSGSGMPPDVISRATEPFFTTKERGKGTGLGLAQVYGFLKQCQGDLHIESQVGNGTTVTMLLPVSAPPAHEPVDQQPVMPLPDPMVAMDKTGSTILVIDDDDDVRSVLAESLLSLGHRVIDVDNGPAGLAWLEKIRPEIAVIDFIMPGMSGAEVARQAQARYPDLPIVFVSGYYDTNVLRDIGNSVILRKPFSVFELQETVSSLLALG